MTHLVAANELRKRKGLEIVISLCTKLANPWHSFETFRLTLALSSGNFFFTKMCQGFASFVHKLISSESPRRSSLCHLPHFKLSSHYVTFSFLHPHVSVPTRSLILMCSRSRSSTCFLFSTTLEKIPLLKEQANFLSLTCHRSCHRSYILQSHLHFQLQLHLSFL